MNSNNSGHIEIVETFARLDVHRRERTGVPETVFAEGKSAEQVVAILRTMCDKSDIALATRVTPQCASRVRDAFQNGFVLTYNELARTVTVQKANHATTPTGACIAVLSAGTSDIPIAEEAKVTAEVMGCKVLTFYDVGVAGIHRLADPLKKILDEDVSAVVVVAGMEGALASVVRGLVPVPVIGVPTSIGYGYGAKGEAALMSMLQSCAPGLTVVNIDNGFGAGATAALIANRIASVRRENNH